MLSLNISEIVQAVGGALVLGDPRGPVLKEHVSVCTDSRTFRSGDIFFAIKGEKFDGHQFLNECIRKRASVCVVSQIPGNLALPSKDTVVIIKVKDTRKALGDLARFIRDRRASETKIVGIAGSCGKTTVKEMTAQILKSAEPTAYTKGNFNNEIGCPLSVLSLADDSVYGVFEIGASFPAEVRRLSEIVRPDVALVTNIRLEHTETFGSLDDIAKGESEILGQLTENGTAVLPRDDAYFEYLRSRVPQKNCRVTSFGLSEDSDVTAKDISFSDGSNFTLVRKDEKGAILSETECTLPVLGKFNIVNACAAAAAAFAVGISADCIKKALASFEPADLRFNVIRLSSGSVIVNDSYNANPGSMKASLDGFVESFPNMERCVVLGDMLELGEISGNEHHKLGKFAASLPLSKIVFYGPQSQFAAKGARESFINEQNLLYCASREQLMEAVHSMVSGRAAILFKASRSMKLDEVVREILEGRPQFTNGSR